MTLIERKSRLMLIRKVSRLTSGEICGTVSDLLNHVAHRHTLTLDNGGEFAAHEKITLTTGTEIYFADPAAVAQGDGFSMVTDEDLAMHVLELNTRPRVVPGGLTPIEVYTGKRVALIP